MGANSLLDQAKEGKMRRVMLMLAAVAMMVSLFAAVAYAAEIQGSDNDETLNESQRNDQIAGHKGEDIIVANFYTLAQTPGGLGDTDKAKGNRGDDTINTQDGDGRDTINGGRGIDTCVADAGDEVKNCEK
jgi:Ca2+-binding RTX toxin-like protein